MSIMVFDVCILFRVASPKAFFLGNGGFLSFLLLERDQCGQIGDFDELPNIHS